MDKTLGMLLDKGLNGSGVRKEDWLNGIVVLQVEDELNPPKLLWLLLLLRLLLLLLLG